MTCLNCDSNDFKEETKSFEIEVERITASYECKAWVCQACGESYMTTEQMGVFLKMVRERVKDVSR